MISLLAIGGATVFSIALALVLECLLLRVILKYVAKSHVDDAAEVTPDPSYQEMKSVAR